MDMLVVHVHVVVSLFLVLYLSMNWEEKEYEKKIAVNCFFKSLGSINDSFCFKNAVVYYFQFSSFYFLFGN